MQILVIGKRPDLLGGVLADKLLENGKVRFLVSVEYERLFGHGPHCRR